MRRVASFVAAAAITSIALAGCDSNTSYTAKVMSYNPRNPADLGVMIAVTNTGQRGGTPICQISAQDPSGAHTGWDSVTMDGAVAAGQTTHFADNVVITHHGAQYVTDVTVSCR
jgi:hypothetical protein